MKWKPNRLGAFTVATIVVGAIGGSQFFRYLNGHGLFYSISPRFGWIPLLLIVVGKYVYIFRGVLRDKDF